MASAAFSVKIEGAERLVAKLNGDRLHRPVLKRSTLKMAKRVEGVVRRAAPRLTGHLVGSVQSRPLGVMSAKVVVTARAYKRGRPANYRYPKRLNYDPRMRSTFGWLDKTKPQAQAAASAELNAIAREIERIWRAR